KQAAKRFHGTLSRFVETHAGPRTRQPSQHSRRLSTRVAARGERWEIASRPPRSRHRGEGKRQPTGHTRCTRWHGAILSLESAAGGRGGRFVLCSHHALIG